MSAPVPAPVPFDPVRALVRRLIGRQHASAAVALIGDERQILAAAARSERRPDSPEDEDVLFDLSSLTKPFVATLALVLDEQGSLSLEARLGEIWSALPRDLARVRLADLLRHRGGYQPWTPLYARCRDAEEARRLLLSGELRGARAGTYSDLGYIVWGLAAEAALGEPVHDLLRRLVLARPGLDDEVSREPELLRIAPCRLDNRREVDLGSEQGFDVEPEPAPPAPDLPQDGNARFLGPRAAHAGLFGSAEAQWELAREWLAPGAWLAPDRVAAALSGRGPYALGWARRRVRGSAGPAIGAAGFGHTGFTGGSVWIDPGDRRIYVLLAHRTRSEEDFNHFRRRFHRLAVGA